MNIIFATKNKGKITEIQNMLSGSPICVKTLLEAGINTEIVEDGLTFEENSAKKAVEIMRISNMLTLADDSGLEIDFLNKQPGVCSARFLGKETPYSEKNLKVLELLKGVPDEKRGARFVSVITAAFPNGSLLSVRDTLEGSIAHEAKGCYGFGYDPIFYIPEFNKTLAELSMEQKNSISHRGKALREMCRKLLEALGEDISSK